MSLGNRGKALEAEVRDFLKEKSKDKTFTFYRLPDARTCGGALRAQPGDYFIFREGESTIILDPKNLQKGNTLNIKNRLSQLPKMIRLGWAGVAGGFLIYHEELEKYFVLWSGDAQALKNSGAKSVKISSLVPYKTLEEAMEEILSA